MNTATITNSTLVDAKSSTILASIHHLDECPYCCSCTCGWNSIKHGIVSSDKSNFVVERLRSLCLPGFGING